MLRAPAGRRFERSQVGDEVDRLLEGHRVIERGHLRGAVGDGVALAFLDDRVRVDDGFGEVLGLVEWSHGRQLGPDLPLLGRGRELRASDLVTGVALELHEDLAAPRGVAVGPGELPVLRRAVAGVRRARRRRTPRRPRLLCLPRRRGNQRNRREQDDRRAAGRTVHRSSTTFTTSATSLSPSCLVVTLRTQPGLRSESESVCSTNPVLPGSVGRTNFTIFDSDLSTIVTSRVLPFATV